MNLNSLTPAKGSVRKNKRVARGQGSGKGGTATRGHKGAQSRSGYSRKIGFEGGQMPLVRRVPKFGFRSPNRIEAKAINLDVIQNLIESYNVNEVTLDVLVAHGLASKNDIIKVLGRGELKTKVDVVVNYISKSALQAIENLGGKVTIL